MPKKETSTSRLEETREGRVPQKSKIWRDVFNGWSLMEHFKNRKPSSTLLLTRREIFIEANFVYLMRICRSFRFLYFVYE